ncbi:heterokaryon incompatibility protein-domain-containing protein [Rhexocercosporidium sp. MPI-PUGE-AT-0058]|nr:heterokaryon incompatibility protein-domain-containing protein [Rhexocercosporidium sp. MPI-PUGE-AT-0058]
MTDSNITSRLRKLRFGRRTSPSRSVPTTKASSVSSQKSKTQLAKIDIYQPLSPSTREIRLLHILPEQPGSLLLGPDPISCVLSHVSLEDKPTYHALSYTWDDESLGQSFEDPDDVKRKRKVLISGFIFLDGQAVEVTPNLWVALWHLRRGANWFKSHPNSDIGEFGEKLEKEQPIHFTYEIPIWVDALCINQLDVVERNQQVQMMGSLFQNAQCVHSWTGLQLPETEDFVNMVELCYSKHHGSTDAEIEIEFSRLLLDQNLGSHWKTLSLICDSTYWHRLWIVQEFILGRQCAVHVGLRTINSNSLTWFSRHVKAIENKMWEKGIVFSTVELHRLPSLQTIQARYLYNEESTLSAILMAFHEYKCSDPRDKIYSLLGLGRNKDYGIHVDYTLDADAVYLNSVLQILNRDRDLSLIISPSRYSCQCTKSQHTLSSLPSWVRDFRCLNEKHESLCTSIEYNPSGHTQAIFSVSRHKNVLVCKGLHIGTISKLLAHDPAMFNPADGLGIGVLARFATEAPIAVDSSRTSRTPSSNDNLGRLKGLYAAMAEHASPAALAANDEVKFIHHLTSPAQADGTNKDEVGRILSLFSSEALFSMSLASTLSSTPSTRLPHGPVFGKCYPFCQEGDVIVALYGCSKLLALRPDAAYEGCFKVLGEVCVPDFINGQAVGMFEERDFELT